MPRSRSSQTSSPSLIVPRSGSASPASTESSVLLPEPERPITHVMPGGQRKSTSTPNSPRRTENVATRSATLEPPRQPVREHEQNDAEQRRRDRHVARRVLAQRDELVDHEDRG